MFLHLMMVAVNIVVSFTLVRVLLSFFILVPSPSYFPYSLFLLSYYYSNGRFLLVLASLRSY